METSRKVYPPHDVTWSCVLFGWFVVFLISGHDVLCMEKGVNAGCLLKADGYLAKAVGHSSFFSKITFIEMTLVNNVM